MHILFISDHDLVRGPVARVLAQGYAEEFRLSTVTFESAGTTASPGTRPPRPLLEYMRMEGYAIGGHASQPLQPSHARRCSLAVCMGRANARAATAILGAAHANKVLVLNEAVSFTARRHRVDIPPFSNGDYLSLTSVMKASVGRFVRLLSQNDIYTADGRPVEELAAQASVLADPQIRAFVAEFLYHQMSRSPQPRTLAQLRASLHAIGRPLNTVELGDLLRHELAGRAVRLRDGRWTVDHDRDDRRETHQSDSSRHSEQPGGAQPPPSKLTDDEALEIIGIHWETPLADAQQRYRNLLKRYHPDRFHDDDAFRTLAESKTQRINAAWERLRRRLK